METYLHVRLTVEKEKVKSFIESAGEFLKSKFLQNKGWTFLFGFEVLAASLIDDLTRKPMKPEGGRDLASFINVWKLPADVDVAAVMVELSELASYVNLDNLVADEQQEIVFRINDPASESDKQLAVALKAGAHFAMVRHYIFRNSLAKFALSSAVLALQLEAATKYKYAGCYQNITGLLNEFWDVWELGGHGKADPAAVREDLARSIAATEGTIAASYKESIFFDTSSLKIVNPKAATEDAKADGPDDGIVVVKAASYWKDL